MYWLVALMSLGLLGIISVGFWLEFNPVATGNRTPRWLRQALGINVISFVIAEIGMLILGMESVMAEPVTGAAREISVGMGLAMIGVGIPTAVAAIAAGIAIGPVGAAALAVIAEKPEAFGRSLIFLGLAEGVAIYGLVVSILMLGKLG
ncbi:ATP synthase F(0) sector subunit c [Gammaproteobacteria bacterium]